jgi:hypothetical protein
LGRWQGCGREKEKKKTKKKKKKKKTHLPAGCRFGEKGRERRRKGERRRSGMHGHPIRHHRPNLRGVVGRSWCCGCGEVVVGHGGQYRQRWSGAGFAVVLMPAELLDA